MIHHIEGANDNQYDNDQITDLDTINQSKGQKHFQKINRNIQYQNQIKKAKIIRFNKQRTDDEMYFSCNESMNE